MKIESQASALHSATLNYIKKILASCLGLITLFEPTFGW